MKFIVILLLLLCSAPVFSQIVFQKDLTWEQLSKKAKAEKKLVFLHLEDDQCQQCNDVASQGFGASILKEKYENNFVSQRSNVKTENGKKLAEKFGITGALVSLYIDADGNILNRFNGSTSAAFVYAEQADIAVGRKGGKKLADYEKEYKAGERSSRFLKEYIFKRKELSLPIDALLEEFVGQLPIDSLKNYEVVRFILGQGPSINSREYNIVQSGAPRSLIDSVYKTIPRAEAVAMNNAIINNTFRLAVEKRDQQLAYQLSGFIQNTYKIDYQNGQLASRRNLIRYWYAVKDTVQYESQVRGLLDYTHMIITVDSLKKLDDAALKRQHPLPPVPFRKEPMAPVNFAPPSQFYHMELNEHAWHFLELSSKPRDLETALKWSYQSMELFNGLNQGRQHPMRLGNPAYLDTYAQILYKLGRKQEAIEWQTKAVEAQKLVGDPASLERTLVKMKAGE